jgi:2-hydroxycyclohexanecarboxyl-CoA dehydrogenase
MGRSICEALARAGRPVAILDANGEGAERVADVIRGEGARAVACRTDVADRADVDKAMDVVRNTLGPIQILVTSAGISRFTPFLDITEESWDRVMEVNLKGTFNCVQSAIPDMIQSSWGRIVLVSSSSAQRGAPRMAHYAASKGGVIALARTLAREFASKGITVNNIAPSGIESPMMDEARQAGNLPDEVTQAQAIPVGRLGTGEDIAAAAMFLCSEGAGFFTGQTVSVNGGSHVT